MKRIWVPLVRRDPDEPDRDAGVTDVYEWERPCRMREIYAPCDMLRFSPDYGKHLLTHVRIGVDDGNEKLFKTAVPEKDVSEYDRLWVRMHEECRLGRWDQNADAFFGSIPMAAAAPEREAKVKKMLVQAVGWGLNSARAEAIRARLALPLAAKTSGPIDDDILRAKYDFGLRSRSRDAVREQILIDAGKGCLSADRAGTILMDLEATSVSA